MLTVITGPMFSGKSSKLISVLVSNVIAGNHAVAFKPEIDNRYGIKKAIVSHAKNQFPAIPIPIRRPDYSTEYISGLKADVVGFDEAQFFERDRLLESIDWFMYKEISVVCAGLSQDSRGNIFGAMPQLLAMADEIIFLKAVCSKCKRIGAATRTYRKEDNDKQVVVGGTDKYEARCYSCWKELH